MEIILNKTKELMSLYENMIDEDDIVEDKKLQTIMELHKTWLLEKETQKLSENKNLSTLQNETTLNKEGKISTSNLMNDTRNNKNLFSISSDMLLSKISTLI